MEVIRKNASDAKLPDISLSVKTAHETSLDRVGMGRIEMPVKIKSDGASFFLPAEIDAFVNLVNPQAKGIHMSRLYRMVRDRFETSEMSFSTLSSVLKDFVETHADLSTASSIRVSFTLPVKRKALLSDESGWRQYPVVLAATLDKGKVTYQAEVKVLYSSTCPCSAALSRQLVAEKFANDFANVNSIPRDTALAWLENESSIVAVPHAQRSEADLKLKFDEESLQQDLSPISFIDLAETSLATPVQGAVKRVDEQEFARLNGANLMFCEDAARKLKLAALKIPNIRDFYIRVSHLESLHPHDAVAVAVMGVENGFQP